MKFFKTWTPTILDIREMSVLGMTTKAEAIGKIGHKGSGIKFALAYLHRLGGNIEVSTPNFHIQSAIETAQVRDILHEMITFKDITEGKTIPANITKHAGEDTWNEPWYILREFLQNAIDENGTWEITEDSNIQTTTGTTTIFPLLPELEYAWNQKEVWFQPRYTEIVSKGSENTKGLYFHHFLIHRATDWNYSYDVTTILERSQLSEDRQLKNGDLSTIFYKIAKAVKFNSFGAELYTAILQPELKSDLENLCRGIESALWDDNWKNDTQCGFDINQFETTYNTVFGQKAAYHVGELENGPSKYYAEAAGYKPVRVNYKIEYILRHHTKQMQLSKCLPSIGERVEKVATTDITKMGKLKLAMRLVKKIQPEGVKIEVIRAKTAVDNLQCGALADGINNKVRIMESTLDKDVDKIARMLIHEYAHLRAGTQDVSQEMQDELTKMVFEVLVKNKRTKAQIGQFE